MIQNLAIKYYFPLVHVISTSFCFSLQLLTSTSHFDIRYSLFQIPPRSTKNKVTLIMPFCLALLYLFLLTPAWSQSELHIANYYGFRDGLNNNFVFCLRQDSRGFLWLGTKEGLNRFDGFQFKEYYTERNNPNSLSHNKVFDILEYKPGFLLFATGSGLSVLNTKTGMFENEKIKFPPLQRRMKK